MVDNIKNTLEQYKSSINIKNYSEKFEELTVLHNKFVKCFDEEYNFYDIDSDCNSRYITINKSDIGTPLYGVCSNEVEDYYADLNSIVFNIKEYTYQLAYFGLIGNNIYFIRLILDYIVKEYINKNIKNIDILARDDYL